MLETVANCPAAVAAPQQRGPFTAGGELVLVQLSGCLIQAEADAFAALRAALQAGAAAGSCMAPESVSITDDNGQQLSAQAHWRPLAMLPGSIFAGRQAAQLRLRDVPYVPGSAVTLALMKQLAV